jgi:hypothetical protein
VDVQQWQQALMVREEVPQRKVKDSGVGGQVDVQQWQQALMVWEEVVEDSSSITEVLYPKEKQKTLVEVGKWMFNNDNNNNNSKGKNTRKKNQQKDWRFMRTIIKQSQREQLLGLSNKRQKTLCVEVALQP